MNANLTIAKDIVKSVAPSFNGDGRLAAVAFQRLHKMVSKHQDDEVKLLAGDIVAEMGPQFKGSLNMACEAFERIYGAIAAAKRGDI